MTAKADRIVARLVGTGEPELSCEACFTNLDRYVDVELSGGMADREIPGMAGHLANCPACAEEHEALLACADLPPTLPGQAPSGAV
jgi:anti-sigma factor RsiW